MTSRQQASAYSRPISTPPLNRKYLRAFHDYQPTQSTLSGSTGGVSVTIPLAEGDIVLVHLTHANGWADGTVLQTGFRGWIPTNFCEPYDHPFIRSLMHALTQLWDYLSSEGGGKAMVEERQDYVQGLIAGVRRLFEHCDCLHRHDDLIQSHVGLRRTRKSLLSDLSSLIKCRKQIQDTFSGDKSNDVSWSTIDEYMGKAFKVACRAVRFLDLWIKGSGMKQLRIISIFDEPIDPPLPSTTTASFSPSSPVYLRLSLEDEAETLPGATSVREMLHFDVHDRPTSRDSHDSRSSQLSQPRSAGAGSLTDHVCSMYPPEAESRFSVKSRSQHRTSSPLLGLHPDYSSGLGIHLEEQRMSDLASERLSAAHDHFLGHIGTFLGLHLQSRTSLDLAAATRGSLEACTGLISVIKEIWLKDPHRSDEVSYAMMIMKRKMGRLADAARKLCDISDPLEDPALMRPSPCSSLVAAATACVRSAGDCTTKARQLLDRNGDFDMDMNHVRCHKIEIELAFQNDQTEGNMLKDDNVGTDEAVSEENVLAESVEDRDSNAAEILPRPRSKTIATQRLSLFPFSPEVQKRPASSPADSNFKITTICVDSPTSTSLGTPITPSSMLKSAWPGTVRKESLGLSITESTSTYPNSLRGSTESAMSPTSTRATTPERSCHLQRQDPALLTSFSSVSSMRSAATASSESSEGEAELLAKSYAHELLFGQEGQVLGGSLRALVEKLTSQHSPPDPTFVNTFYLTFRLFTNAVDLAQTLITRYQYVGESKVESMPARLRVFNFMKGWLESHWLSEYDGPALELIQSFATDKLQQLLPGPSQRLAELAEKASQRTIANSATQLVSSIGKMSVSLGTQYEKESVPNAILTRNQLNSLRTAHANMSTCFITDFDALELARQFTLMQSRTFCAVEAEELLKLEWTKNTDTSVNVRRMARFATDLANFIADTILSVDDSKKRAAVLKQWIKIGKICQDMSNYDCLMAIVCSLTSSTILRLKATWEQVAQKWKTQFDELKNIVDVSRNYAFLRQRLLTPRAPCLPFIGIYLTDLTFVDAGNQDTRTLPSSDDTAQPIEVINFDKHTRTAKVISQLQRYQVPYRLQPVPELQTWIEAQLTRVHKSEDCYVQSFWRRSLKLEPRARDPDMDSRPSTAGGSSGFRLGHKVSKSELKGVFSEKKLDFLSTLGFKNDGELKAKLAGVAS